jgi:hypothetical protein
MRRTITRFALALATSAAALLAFNPGLPLAALVGVPVAVAVVFSR